MTTALKIAEAAPTPPGTRGLRTEPALLFMLVSFVDHFQDSWYAPFIEAEQ
jgi:hypothetical protein